VEFCQAEQLGDWRNDFITVGTKVRVPMCWAKPDAAKGPATSMPGSKSGRFGSSHTVSGEGPAQGYFRGVILEGPNGTLEIRRVSTDTPVIPRTVGVSI